MDALEKLAAGIKHVDSLLDESVLEPDMGRTDWARMKARVGMVRDGLDQEVLGMLDLALAEAEDSEVRGYVGRRVASLLSAAAALVHASGDEMGAAKLRARAVSLTPDDDEKEELRAGDAEPLPWVRLQHARWLYLHHRRGDAERAAKAVIRGAKAGALRSAAKKIVNAPRPISSAPTLFRLNGCGVGLYGSRDRTSDGWYVATYCLCILWIPVLPLTAYRVRHAGGNTYHFAAKEALGPIARAWQLVLAAAAVIGLGWSGVTSWLDSPDHRAKVAIEEAQKAEAKGDRQGALEKYAAALREFDGVPAAAPAAEAVLRLAEAIVPDPCTVDAVDKVGRVVDEWSQMPATSRAATAGPLAKQLATWAGQIGEGTTAAVNAGLTVLDMAAKVAEQGGDRKDIDARRGGLRRALAGKVAAARPLQALNLYVQPPASPESLVDAAKIVDGLGAGPSLWLEAEEDVLAWAKEAEKHPDFDEAAKRTKGSVRAAHETHDADQALIEVGDEKKLAAALARTPDDQEIAAAVAQIRRRHGDVKGAIAVLSALGPPGRMTADAQRLLADCHIDLGDAAKAESILSDLVAERLPAFQIAQRAFEGAMDQLRSSLIAQAKLGNIDDALKRQLEGAPEKEQGSIFRDWLSQRMQADPQINALRAEYVRRGVVVPAALSLGLVELRRANAATGEERRGLLAAAEKTLLSIRTEAEGNPSFHVGLGQVYHRLGKAEEGDKELGLLLERNDPELTLEVASVYRELGLLVRSKQILEQLWGSSAPEEWKQQAAALLSLVVTELGFNEDEEETWLKRADPNAAEIKRRLLGIEARRLRREGKVVEADRAYQRICEELERDAGHDAAAANNAAIAYLDRYRVTGDPAHLRSAVKHLEASRRLSPEAAIIVHNLAGTYDYLATITVLDRWIKTKSLALEESEASSVLSSMLSGPLRDDVLAALRKDPSFHRALDLAQEEQALAPQRSDGYGRQIEWLRWTDDDKGLSDLEKRLEAMPPFDASTITEARRTARTRSKDALARTVAAQGVVRAKDTLDRAERGGHEPTIAAARLVLATQLSARAYLDPTDENLDAMIEASRKAGQVWPDGAMDEPLGGLLAWTGLVRASRETPSIKKVLDDDGRVAGTAQLILRASRAPDGEGALAALRRRPEIAEAARLLKARMKNRPGLLEVMVARAAGDAEMEQAASAAFQRAGLGAELAIAAIMAPGQDLEKEQLDFWKSGGKTN